MSDSREVPRYLYDEQYPGQYSARCDLVPASAYDAAQAELSALREELASWKARYVRRVEDIQLVAGRLTAAEQRNAGLVELLQECVNVVRFGDDFDLPVTTMTKIDNAIKPTESGASE